MRRTVLLLTLVAAVLLACAGVVVAQPDSTTSDPSQPSAEDTVAGEILVKFKEETSQAKKQEVHGKKGGQVKETIPGIDVQVVSVERGKEKSKAKEYKDDSNVEYAEVNGVYHADEASADATTNDTRVGEQWAFNNTGQTGGTSGADIRAFNAWDQTPGSNQVAIAVLDTGISSTHEDLQQGKVTLNRDFTGSASGHEDKQGHGTHVAGSVAANSNNGKGVAGTCGDWSNCVLYNGKVLNDSGSGSWSGIANGIRWAADNGAKVISMSLGGTYDSQTVHDAVNYAWGSDDNGNTVSDKRAVVVAAAGNSGSSSPHYPAYYKNVIAVGATDHYDKKASYSNYGSWVDVAAPGSSILSTTVDGAYGTKSGTSMATPHVAGTAGLIWSTSLGTTNSEVRRVLEKSATDRTGLSGTGPDWSKARINACQAVYGDELHPSCTPPDTTAPKVSTTNPNNGATGVSRSTNVTVTFDEAVDPATLRGMDTDPTNPTFTLLVWASDGQDGERVSATMELSSDGKTATLNPYGSTSTNHLAGRTKYKATVKGGSGGVKDLAGNPLAQDKVWTFTTKR